MFRAVKADYINSHKSRTVILIMFVYRLGNKVYYSSKHKLLKRMILFILNNIYKLLIYFPYHIDIPFQATIGKGLRLIHYQGIVINGSTVIGDNCTIFHQVTIGLDESEGSNRKAAQIGNNVYIGCGAKLIGNIKIGDNVTIGANTVVTKDIPSNCTVVGINRIIKKDFKS